MGFVLMFHSIIRWLVVFVAVAALVKFAIGWLRGGGYGKMDRGLASGFSGLLDLQALLGLLYFLVTGFAGAGFPMYRIEHLTIMLVAVIVGHLPSRWKGAASRTRFRNGLFVILFALVLVYVGVSRLPQGWSR